jgi:hypothetical protein
VRFPYAIYFREDPEAVTMFVVMHGASSAWCLEGG